MRRPLNRSRKILIVISVLTLLIALTSCRTSKETLITTITDSTSVKVESIPFDTLVWIKNHSGKEQEFTNCDSLYALLSRHSGTLVTKENGVKSTITNSGKRLVFKCQTDSLLAEIELLKERITKEHTVVITKEVPANCKKEHCTWIDGLYKRGFWIYTALILVFVGFRYRKVIFPFLK